LADVRAAAREGMIEVPEAFQTLPVTANAIAEAFVANKEKMKIILKEADFVFLEKLSDNSETSQEDQGSDEKAALAMIMECTIIHFGDDNIENNCVYMIFKNDRSQRITLCFRGSITLQDWIKDSKVFVDDIPNPVSDRPSQPPTIGVHLGFKEYLYEESRSMSFRQLNSIVSNFGSFMSTGSEDEPRPTVDAASDADGSETNTNSWNFTTMTLALERLKEKTGITGTSEKRGSVNIDSVSVDDTKVTEKTENLRDNISSSVPERRLDKILKEIESIRKENNDYSVYITGHSLGGALGLLTALEAGTCFGKVGLPVTFVGIANPRGGTEGFRDAVSVLEKEGKLRCICVHGVHDIVPMIPASAINRIAKKRFCQSGIELVLKKDKFEMRYSPKSHNSYIKRIGIALGTAHKISERHHYLTYLDELGRFSEPLRELHLNDYYNKIYDSEIFVPSKKKLTPRVVRVHRDDNVDNNTHTYVLGEEIEPYDSDH